MADIVKVDCLDLNLDELVNIVGNLKQLDVMLLAEKVEDNDMFQRCLDLGFDLFQGFFFSGRRLYPERKSLHAILTVCGF